MPGSAEGQEATLGTLHRDLRDARQRLVDIKAGLGDLNALVASGLRSLPQPERAGEVVRLLRESHRLNEERFAQLDAVIREHALVTHTFPRALAEGQRQLVEGQRQLVLGQRSLSEETRALIARIDALINGHEAGSPRR